MLCKTLRDSLRFLPRDATYRATYPVARCLPVCRVHVLYRNEYKRILELYPQSGSPAILFFRTKGKLAITTIAV